MIYVVVGCHFKSRTELCDTTIARLSVALQTARPSRGDRILLLGDVPYETGGPTLSGLMYNWLTGKGFPGKFANIIHDDVGTFSGAAITCGLVTANRALGRAAGDITVISSPWYFLQGKRIWKRRAWENNLRISFISVQGTGGWRTWLLYGAIAFVTHIAITVGLEKVAEFIFTGIQSKRAQGFTLNGCK